MYSSQYFIDTLKMEAHPEGGFYKSSFYSSENISSTDLKNSFEGERSLWTSIYFLLRNGEISSFHRLKSDEMWYYHAGSPLTIYMINPEGKLTTKQLGLNIENGETPQFLVPKNYIFGSSMNSPGYSLVGCMLSPGFDFKDFEMFERNVLLTKYPEHKDIIVRLTK